MRRGTLKNLRFIDSNCFIGSGDTSFPGQCHTPKELLREMDYYGIDVALVSHILAKDGNSEFWNRVLMKEIKPYYPRLVPCPILVPHHADEMDEPRRLIPRLIKEGVRAVRICPGSRLGFSMAEWFMGDLLRTLEEYRLPTLLSVGLSPKVTWEEIDSVCSRHPDLPLILTDVPWIIDRLLFALMKRHRNLYIETSYYQVHRAPENISKRFGAERLIFGTGMPWKSPGAAVLMVTHSMLSLREKQLIAGGNIERLMGGVKACEKPSLPPARPWEIRETVDRWMDEFILDFHVHLYPFGTPVPRGSAEGIIETFDLIGVDKACIFGPLGDCRWVNDHVYEAQRRFPDRLIAFCSVNPNYPEVLESELKRCMEGLKMKGVKIHPSAHGYPPQGPNYEPLWEHAERLGYPVITDAGEHLRYGKPSQFEEVLKEHPELKLVMAHVGRHYPSADEYTRVAKKYPNVYVEITFSSVTYGIIEYLVKIFDDERILYGSDMPWRDPRPQLGWVLYAKINEESKRKILGLNAARLLGIEPRKEARRTPM